MKREELFPADFLRAHARCWRDTKEVRWAEHTEKETRYWGFHTAFVHTDGILRYTSAGKIHHAAWTRTYRSEGKPMSGLYLQFDEINADSPSALRFDWSFYDLDQAQQFLEMWGIQNTLPIDDLATQLGGNKTVELLLGYNPLERHNTSCIAVGLPTDEY